MASTVRLIDKIAAPPAPEDGHMQVLVLGMSRTGSTQEFLHT